MYVRIGMYVCTYVRTYVYIYVIEWELYYVNCFICNDKSYAYVCIYTIIAIWDMIAHVIIVQYYVYHT